MTRHRGKHWPLKAPPADRPLEDPYDPTSKGYALRSRQAVTHMADGTARVDIGAPIARNADEPQPSPVEPPKAIPVPAEEPQEAQRPDPAAKPTREPREAEWKPGLGKRP